MSAVLFIAALALILLVGYVLLFEVPRSYRTWKLANRNPRPGFIFDRDRERLP